MEKLTWYLFQHIDVAKQLHLLDSTHLGSLSHDITLSPHVIQICAPELNKLGSGICILTVCSLAFSIQHSVCPFFFDVCR